MIKLKKRCLPKSTTRFAHETRQFKFNLSGSNRFLFSYLSKTFLLIFVFHFFYARVLLIVVEILVENEKKNRKKAR